MDFTSNFVQLASLARLVAKLPAASQQCYLLVHKSATMKSKKAAASNDQPSTKELVAMLWPYFKPGACFLASDDADGLKP